MCWVNNNLWNMLKAKIIEIVNHPVLEEYFNTNSYVHNERDIISQTGLSIRPDRLIINSRGEVVIIDYKSGLENKKHIQQLQLYGEIVEEMHLKVLKKILIYINDTVFVRIV